MGFMHLTDEDVDRRRKKTGEKMGTVEVFESRRRGAKARLAGRPVWSNPYIGKVARAWTAGWNSATGGGVDGKTAVHEVVHKRLAR